jgi:hypothetical protein
MTAAEFQRLPLLLERAQVMQVTGWSVRTLRRAVAEGIVRRKATGLHRGKYVRDDVARVCGL